MPAAARRILGSALALLPGLAGAQTEADAGFLWQPPVVLSASQMLQPKAEAAAGVIVLDRAMIRALGGRDIADLLRRLPGVNVAFESGHNAVVAYHGMNNGYGRRLQVLLDGRPVYDPLLGGARWQLLAVDIDEIERIEFVRGPTGSIHGSDAFLGTIAVYTRRASEDQGMHLVTRVGSNSTRDIGFRTGALQHGYAHHTSVSYQSDDGLGGRPDRRQQRSLRWHGDLQLDANTLLTARAGLSEANLGLDLPWAPCVQPHTRDTDRAFVQLSAERSDDHGQLGTINFTVQRNRDLSEYTQRGPAASVFYLPDCTGLDDRRRYETLRTDLEARQWMQLSDRSRVLLGVGARQDRIDGVDRVGGVAGSPWINNFQISLGRAFAHLEHRVTADWLLHAGAMLEYNDHSGSALSWRLAGTHRIDANQGLRLGAAHGTRNPALIEGSWRNDYWRGNTVTDPEQVTTTELGYLLELPAQALEVDLRVYRDRLRELITSPPSLAPWAYLNAGRADISGLEAVASWRPDGRTLLRLGYAYTDIDSDNPGGAAYHQSAPRHGADLLLGRQFGAGLHASAAYTYYGPMLWMDDGSQVGSTRWLDLRLAQAFGPAQRRGEFAITLRNALGEQPTYNRANEAERSVYAELRLDL